MKCLPEQLTTLALPMVANKLREGAQQLASDKLADSESEKILNSLRKIVLNTAKRFGKARFAQIAARHVDQATTLPKYLADAARWLVAS